ncbi:MAG: alpha amylase C-terminal domain-containing protein, partial [Trichodesmium sp. St16_bin4-tuft]|nr:alpha amylase C-terminal domain-containing protein [Trichodesmium sp. St16_bin4-tuft]
PGFYTEIFNSDAGNYGGSNMGNLGGKWTDDWFFHNYQQSLDLCLPPLGVVVFQLDKKKTIAMIQESEDVETVEAKAKNAS